MTIDEAIMTQLFTETSITNVVGTKIYPDVRPQESDTPCVVIQKISAPRLHAFQSDYGASARMQITSWGATKSDSMAASEAIRGVLQNWLNTLMGTVYVTAVILDNETSFFDDNVREFANITDYIFWYRE